METSCEEAEGAAGAGWEARRPILPIRPFGSTGHTDRAPLGWETWGPPPAASLECPSPRCLQLPRGEQHRAADPLCPVPTRARMPSSTGAGEGTHLEETQHPPQAVQYGRPVGLEKEG